jgi:hypothetical protein
MGEEKIVAANLAAAILGAMGPELVAKEKPAQFAADLYFACLDAINAEGMNRQKRGQAQLA